MRKFSSFDTKTKERPSRAQCSLCKVTEWSKAAVNSLPGWSPALPPTGSRETCSHTPSSYFFPYCHNVCISTHKCKFQVAIKTWNRLGNKYSKYFFFYCPLQNYKASQIINENSGFEAQVCHSFLEVSWSLPKSKWRVSRGEPACCHQRTQTTSTIHPHLDRQRHNPQN